MKWCGGMICTSTPPHHYTYFHTQLLPPLHLHMQLFSNWMLRQCRLPKATLHNARCTPGSLRCKGAKVHECNCTTLHRRGPQGTAGDRRCIVHRVCSDCFAPQVHFTIWELRQFFDVIRRIDPLTLHPRCISLIFFTPAVPCGVLQRSWPHTVSLTW